MDATLTLLDLAGAAALLLWGVHMVQSGVQRAFGPSLRRLLAAAFGDRGRALLAGLGVTAALQSSTAVGLMVASFAAGGAVGLAPALAALLGAGVGSTLIVQLFSFDVARAAPLLVLTGVILFRREAAGRGRDLGRASIGLGLMLMALAHLLALTRPYEDLPSLRLLLGAVATEPVVAALLAAVMTWLAHSSVAVVLLVTSLAANGVVAPEGAFALVLGANVGTAINPLLEGGARGSPAALRVTAGNLLIRVAAAVLALAFLAPLGALVMRLDPDPARAAANFHTGFNLLLTVILFPVLGPLAALLRRLVPERAQALDPSRPVYLDPALRPTPALALAAASRETLRLADLLEAMVQGAIEALGSEHRRPLAAVRAQEATLDRLNAAIKAYLAALDPDDLDGGADERRIVAVLAFAMNLEQAGDVVANGIMALAAKRQKRGLVLAGRDAAQLRAALERLAGNVRMAAGVFMGGDPRAARRLADEKGFFRDVEAAAAAGHLRRLRGADARTAAASALALDLLRDAKRLNAHLVAGAAYPVLDEQGDLLRTRVRG